MPRFNIPKEGVLRDGRARGRNAVDTGEPENASRLLSSFPGSDPVRSLTRRDPTGSPLRLFTALLFSRAAGAVPSGPPPGARPKRPAAGPALAARGQRVQPVREREAR